MQEVRNSPETNGRAPESLEEKAIDSLRGLIREKRDRAIALETELAAIAPELRAYEKALGLLTGEAPARRKKRDTSAGTRRTEDGGFSRSGSKLGPDRLDAIRAGIFEFARDHEEFRQVDYRTSPLGGGMTSSLASLAFEALRQENTLRVARIDGNQKFYRLTREALHTDK